MRWEHVSASLGAHALVLAALAWAPGQSAPARPPAARPLDVLLLEARPELAPAAPAAPTAPPAPAPTAPPAPVAAPRRTGVASATVHGGAPGRTEPVPAPRPASPAGTGLGMRSVAPTGQSEVQAPPGRAVVGRPEGAPPADELSPGVLGGQVRLPPLPGPLAHPTAPGQAARLGPAVVADGNGGYREDRQTFRGRVDRDGTVRFSDKGNVGVDSVGATDLGMTLAGHFDLTDALMRLHGEDPYRYEKARFMDRTRDERARMAVDDQSERLREAIARTPRELERLWSRTAWPEAQRRRVLFALWDEVAEDGSPELVKTGVAVRAAILGFVRRRLPEASPQAFTPGELEQLNRERRSRARFEPYRR